MTFTIGTGVAGALAILIIKATLLLLVALGASALLQRASAGARHLVWVAIVAALLVLPALTAWSPLKLAILPPAAFTSGVVPANQLGASSGAVSVPTEAAPKAANTASFDRSVGEVVTADRAALSPWQIVAADRSHSDNKVGCDPKSRSR